MTDRARLRELVEELRAEGTTLWPRREFTPRTDTHGRYLLDKIPATLWRDVKAKAKRERISVRALILGLLTDWLKASAPERKDR